MCFRPETVDEQCSDREKLERALQRLSAVSKEYCNDAKIALAAAHKHLASLPVPPPRKVKVNVSARVDERGKVIRTWTSAGGDFAYPPPLTYRVELSGEYEAPHA